MQTAVVIGIVLIAGLLLLRSFVKKARGKEGCGCESCEMAAQCESQNKDSNHCDRD